MHVLYTCMYVFPNLNVCYVKLWLMVDVSFHYFMLQTSFLTAIKHRGANTYACGIINSITYGVNVLYG